MELVHAAQHRGSLGGGGRAVVGTPVNWAIKIFS